MPLYAYECERCGREETAFRTIEDRHDGPLCHGVTMRKVILPAPVQADLPGYVSPATGKWIEGRAARRDDLARSGCRPWEGMEEETKVARQRAAEAERREDAALEVSARKAWSEMAPSKRKALESA